MRERKCGIFPVWKIFRCLKVSFHAFHNFILMIERPEFHSNTPIFGIDEIW